MPGSRSQAATHPPIYWWIDPWPEKQPSHPKSTFSQPFPSPWCVALVLTSFGAAPKALHIAQPCRRHSDDLLLLEVVAEVRHLAAHLGDLRGTGSHSWGRGCEVWRGIDSHLRSNSSLIWTCKAKRQFSPKGIPRKRPAWKNAKLMRTASENALKFRCWGFSICWQATVLHLHVKIHAT